MKTNESHLDIVRAKDFKSYLQEELLNRCRKNSSYSLRAFAKHLNIGHAALAEMVNGKRKIKGKSVEKIGLGLGLSMGAAII